MLLLDKMTYRIDGIGNAGPINLHRRHPEPRISRHRQTNHLPAVPRRRRSLTSLVRRNRGGNKNDLVEAKSLADLLGAAQMAPMNRIEGAAEETDSHGVSISFFCRPLKRVSDARPGRILRTTTSSERLGGLISELFSNSKPGTWNSKLTRVGCFLRGVVIPGSAHPPTQQ